LAFLCGGREFLCDLYDGQSSEVGRKRRNRATTWEEFEFPESLKQYPTPITLVVIMPPGTPPNMNPARTGNAKVQRGTVNDPNKVTLEDSEEGREEELWEEEELLSLSNSETITPPTIRTIS
jgi:hypothetical protein